MTEPVYADPEAISGHVADVIPLARPVSPRLVTEAELAAMSTDVSAPPEPGQEEELPAHLLNVPGLVGHLTRWIVKTSLFPQPMLAMGAALAVVGTVAGRKFAGPTKSGTHLYILGLAPTGAGKNHPAKMAKRILRAADMQEFLGPGQFMSEPAVYQYVSAQPQMLCVMDEFGSYLQRINSPKGASGYEKAISGALRSFWGSSFDTVQPPAWAQSGSRDKLKPIHSPALSIYGMSVHDEFYAALQSADIANGFLNRFLVLSTQNKPEEVEPELDEDNIDGTMLAMLQNVGATGYAAKPRMAEGWQADVRLDWANADARLHYLAFRKSISDRGEDLKLLSRTPEMAVRLATIRAIGRAAAKANCAGASVNLEDIAWGCELALWSGERMMADATAYMVESEHQGRTQEVLRYIKKAKGGRITKTDLYRRVRYKYDARALQGILVSLQDTDQIEVVRVTTDGASKPTDFIILKAGG
jgi:hypothetical protein